MQEEQYFNNDVIPIGKEIAVLRTLLDLSQGDFGNLMFASRFTVNKLEAVQELENISNDIIFRLYYLVTKIIEDPDAKTYVKNQASKIKDQIDEIMIKRQIH